MSMVDGRGLPRQVTRSLDLLVDSLSGLEVLIALYRENGRTWTAAQMASYLRITPRVAQQELERLGARGVVESEGAGGASLFCYRPIDRAHAAHVARVAEAYATRHIETINHVASGSLKRMRAGSV
jgi:predicted ArsR family transcriptional regulator